MKMKNICALGYWSAIFIAMVSGCIQEQVQPQVATLPPATTQPSATQPPATTLPPVTQPPTTQPPTTTAPATTAPPTTIPPSTISPPAKILEIYDAVVTEDANTKIVIKGKVRNNGNVTMFNVMVVAAFYNDIGQVMKTEKTAPRELAPGQSADFKIFSDILRSAVKRYTLDAEGSSTPIQATPAPAKVNIAIRNYAFSPSTLTVKKGTTVTWINEDSVPHNVVSVAGEIKSKNLGKGESYAFIFNEAGEYGYYCSIHPLMKGSIIVE